MNLTKLFEAQKVLRNRIAYNEPDRFNKLILALLVELGECANEWRGFKFWSKDQKPKQNVQRMTKNGWVDANPLLEEYVDGTHFLLELGIEIGFEDYWSLEDNTHLDCSIEELFIHVYGAVTDLRYANDKEMMYIILFQLYNQLGKMLGFTWEQIEQAYFEKNKVNHERQESGY